MPPTPTELKRMRRVAVTGWETIGSRTKASEYLHIEIDEEAGDGRRIYRLTDQGANYLIQHEGFRLQRRSDGSWDIQE